MAEKQTNTPILTRTTSANSVLPPGWKEQKTSLTHPINISWIVPTEVLEFLSVSDLPKDQDLYDYLEVQPDLESLSSSQRERLEKLKQTQKIKGNLCLSSCPGKKVRLSGPVRGRATINRDLDLDFERMRKFNITMIVCCLNDYDLEYLGVPWAMYETTAKKHDIKIIRLPMIEGSCPKTLLEVRKVVEEVNKETDKGNNVLSHCRGGVGRAGLFAGCWLLENFLCKTAERTVYVLRERRSSKAIETYSQAEFLVRYAVELHHRSGIHFEGPIITQVEDKFIPNEPNRFMLPSISLVAKLENEILIDPLFAHTIV